MRHTDQGNGSRVAFTDKTRDHSPQCVTMAKSIMRIPFTDQELKRAWRQLTKTSLPSNNGQPENAHRLLLFYAVECGLKVVWLKRNGRTLFTVDDINQTGHNLAGTLAQLRAGHRLELPHNIQLSEVRASDGRLLQRNGSLESLHQVWRYGGQCHAPCDTTCEQQLEQVLEWINGELQ